jgi:hypothetical protein
MDFGPLAFGQISIEHRFSDNPLISLRSTFSLESLNDGRATLEEAFWGRAYNASKTVVLNDTDLTSAKCVPSIRDNHVTRPSEDQGWDDERCPEEEYRHQVIFSHGRPFLY